MGISEVEFGSSKKRFNEPGSSWGQVSWTKKKGIWLCHRGLQTQPLLSLPPQSLHLVAPVWNGGARGIRGMSSAVAPEGNQRKTRMLLRFLADRFYDVAAVREYLFRKQVSDLYQKNR